MLVLSLRRRGFMMGNRIGNRYTKEGSFYKKEIKKEKNSSPRRVVNGPVFT